MTELDDFIFSLNLENNLIIIGDLNMDLLDGNIQNEKLLDFILDNNLEQAVIFIFLIKFYLLFCIKTKSLLFNLLNTTSAQISILNL